LATGWRQPLQLASAVRARLIGRPALFHPRLFELADTGRPPGLYDVTPLRNTLIEMIDFDRVNDNTTRISVVAVDVKTGEEVVFDSHDERIVVEHLLASAALIRDFPPVTINGRVLVDGGLADNVPLDVVLSGHPEQPLTCFVVDLFPTSAAPPSGLFEAMQRQNDLMFANQTRRSLRFQQEIWGLREQGPPASVYWLEYRGTADEIAMKSYDFSRPILERRWQAGEQDMRTALRARREMREGQSGLIVYRPTPDGVEESA
jgi:NTE family protein